jgi:antitoxin component YwqK of YwqJK toxin-antitoxin module
MENGPLRIGRIVALLLCVFVFTNCGPSDGPHEDKYANGKMKEEGAYRGGEKVGQWTYYWKNGSKKTVGRYDKGKPTGTWIYYSDTGASLGKGTYKNGKMWNGTFVRFVMGIPKTMRVEKGKDASAK